jgi:hypothetical protein
VARPVFELPLDMKTRKSSEASFFDGKSVSETGGVSILWRVLMLLVSRRPSEEPSSTEAQLGGGGGARMGVYMSMPATTTFFGFLGLSGLGL